MSLSASLQKFDQRIFLKGEHQAAVVYLGQLALSDLSAADFTLQVATILTQVIQPDCSFFWELEEDGENLSVMAGSGKTEGSSPFRILPASLEDATLSSADPVMIDRSMDHFMFSVLDSVTPRNMKSGVSLRIGTMEKPYGILQVFSSQEHFFSRSDTYFLQNAVNLVGLFLHTRRCLLEQESAPQTNMTRKKSAIQTGGLEWDRYEVKDRLVESQERERLRLAQDLHDIPIQDLYGMIYQLDDLREAVKEPEGEKILEECEHTLHRVVNSLRSICRELRPPSLSPFGLEVAIRDHMEKFRDQNPNIRVHLELMPDRQVLSDRMRLSLFRIYQQAIHNVARHAQAGDVHIRFRWDDRVVILEVDDNGIGFEVPANWMELVREEHFGLLGIAERVESMRGRLEVVSTLGNGTLVRVIAPYSRNDTV